MSKIDELMDIVVAGDDLAAEDAAFLCQRLDGFAWYRALERAGIAASKERKAAAQGRASDGLSPTPSSFTAEQGA